VIVDGFIGFANWNSILQSLPNNGKGSRIVFVSALEGKEAAYANPELLPLKIENINKEECRNLFLRKFFGADREFRHDIFQSPCYTQILDKECNDVFEITDGLPLAIVVLAGILRSKGIKGWAKVFNQLKSDDKPKQVKMILALSFDDLPSRLKFCFLYFAGMPKNTIINAKRLVRLWAAEGFLNPDDGKTMEDTGQYYLKELISRGMINLVQRDINGGVWLVAIHDRLHTLTQEKARQESFLEVHDNAHAIAPGSVRRLHLHNCMQSYVPMGTSFPKMRSILGDFAENRSRDVETGVGGLLKNQGSYIDLRDHALRFLQGSKFLRVIDLRGLRITKVPREIGGMVHVRYLGLWSRYLTELPSSIARLTNLQTLDIKRTEVKKVAEAFWEIPTLQHVMASKLRLPKSSGVLNDMQTLTGFVCHDPSGDGITPLHHMVHLRSLDISGLTERHWQGLADIFKKLESLLNLRLAGDNIPFSLFTRFALRRLQILELSGRIDASNVDMQEKCTLPNLTRLVLKLTMADQTLMNMISELPSLMELVMSEESYGEETLVFQHGGFSNVRSLVMTNLTKLSELTLMARSIPNIRRIALSGCSKMKIKFERERGDQLEDLDEVVLYNMPPEVFIVGPTNDDFRCKFDRVIIKGKTISENI
jgi:Leucine-rich repeat (LRR) protein